TQTNTHTQTFMQKHTQTHTHAHSHTHSLTHTHTHTLRDIHTLNLVPVLEATRVSSWKFVVAFFLGTKWFVHVLDLHSIQTLREGWESGPTLGCLAGCLFQTLDLLTDRDN